MFNAIFKGILSVLGWVLDLVLTPINLLIDNLFPNMASYIELFTTFITRYVGGILAYFSNFIPPFTKQVILMWLIFLIAYYGIAWGYSLIIKIWNLIQKLKFW